MKSETKQKVISDLVEFRHAYLQIPAVLVDHKIINTLQVMAGALQNAPPPTSSNQLDAIEMLPTLFGKWKLLAPQALLIDSRAVRVPHVSPPLAPSRVQDMTLAPNHINNLFHALENDDDNDTPSATTWLLPPLPASVPQTPEQCARIAPFQQAIPTRLVFDDVASPSKPSTTPEPSPPPLPRVSATPSAIAHCTRSRLGPPRHSLALEELVQYHIPTAKTTQPQNTLASQFAGLCQALALLEPKSTQFACLCVGLSTLEKGHSLVVLDKESSRIANSDKTHATMKFGTAHALMNLGVSTKA